MQSVQSRRQAPLYAIGTRLTAPLGVCQVRGVHRSTRTDRYLVEVAYENRRGIFTYLESELAHIVEKRPAAPRFTPGESAHTPAGEVIIRNIIAGTAGTMALVQDIGTQLTRTIPVADLTPPLEAA